MQYSIKEEDEMHLGVLGLIRGKDDAFLDGRMLA